MALPGISLNWNESAEPLATFLRYQVYRREEGETAWMKIVRITNRAITFYDDYLIAANQTYEYAVTLVADISGEEIESAFPTEVSATHTFQKAFLHDINAPSNFADLPQQSPRRTLQTDTVSIQVWSRAAPTMHIGNRRFYVIDMSARWTWDEGIWADIETLVDRQINFGSVLMYRDRRGNRFFCQLTRQRVADDVGLVYSHSIQLQETYYDEAVI